MLELVYVSLAMFCPPIIAIASALLVADLVDRVTPTLTSPPPSYLACPKCHYNLEGHHLEPAEVGERDNPAARFEPETNGVDTQRSDTGDGHSPPTLAPDGRSPSQHPRPEPRWPFARRFLTAVRLIPADRGDRASAPPLTIIRTHCPECGAFVTHPDLVPLNDFTGRRQIVWTGRLLIASTPAGIFPPWMIYSFMQSSADQSDALVFFVAALASVVLAIAAVFSQCFAILLLTSVLDWRYCREEAGGWIGMAIVLNTTSIWVAFVIGSVVLLAV